LGFIQRGLRSHQPPHSVAAPTPLTIASDAAVLAWLLETLCARRLTQAIGLLARDEVALQEFYERE